MSDASEIVTDSLGRRLTLRKLKALDKAKLFKAIGAMNASNEPYVGYTMLAAMVSDIDGVPMAFPVNDIQIESAISRVGDEGFNAIAKARSDADAAAVKAAEDAAANASANSGEAVATSQ